MENGERGPALNIARAPNEETVTESTGTHRTRYLVGIACVLLLNVSTAAVDSRLLSDGLVFLSILLIGLVFFQLFHTFHCTPSVRILLFLGVVSLAFGQIFSIVEEISAWDNVPVIGNASAWNGFFDTLGMVTGLVLVLSALVLAVIDLGNARNALTKEVAVRTQTERALEKHRVHLEDEVRNRTAALEHAQDELLVQERLAALGEIMSAVSHELRNPLGVIRGSLFTLDRYSDTEKDSRIQRALDRCNRSITRCDHIIEELHDFSHAQEVSQQLMPLDDWLKELIERAALPESIDCQLDLQADATVPLDPDRMGRALRHLIDNSVEAFEDTGDRGKELMISSLIDASRCRIQIRDTGAGMTPEELEQVGTPLFSTRAFGAGLGVPIATETIRRHGGTVHYESESNKGTTVTIELPLAALSSSAQTA